MKQCGPCASTAARSLSASCFNPPHPQHPHLLHPSPNKVQILPSKVFFSFFFFFLLIISANVSIWRKSDFAKQRCHTDLFNTYTLTHAKSYSKNSFSHLKSDFPFYLSMQKAIIDGGKKKLKNHTFNCSVVSSPRQPRSPQHESEFFEKFEKRSFSIVPMICCSKLQRVTQRLGIKSETAATCVSQSCTS